MKGGKRPGAGRPKKEATKPIRLPLRMIPSVMRLVENNGFKIPLFNSKVPAGFPSPADDYVEKSIDLNELLIHHPSATFLVRATGNSMINAGIYENDILVVDRSLKPTPGKIVIAVIDEQLTVKRLHQSQNGQYLLMPENPDYQPIVIKEGSELTVWGVVTCVLHAL